VPAAPAVGILDGYNREDYQMTHSASLHRWPVVMLALIAGEGTWADEAAYRDIPSSASQPERAAAITVLPAYPADEQADRAVGETTVCFDVDSRGRVARPSVSSSTHESFERPAIKAIRASTFMPIAKDRIRSGSAMCRVYNFDPDATLNRPTELGTGGAASIAGNASSLSSMALLARPAGTDTSSAQPGAGAQAMLLAERGDATICRTMQRPGSRISERICYTREQELAAQEASKRTVADLEREQHFRDQAIQEAAMKNRFPGAPGMPNR
jgi:TonB family protein